MEMQHFQDKEQRMKLSLFVNYKDLKLEVQSILLLTIKLVLQRVIKMGEAFRIVQIL
jgi:hypothetical protein